MDYVFFVFFFSEDEEDGFIMTRFVSGREVERKENESLDMVMLLQRRFFKSDRKKWI